MLRTKKYYYGLSVEIARHTAELKEYIQRFFDLMQREYLWLFFILFLSLLLFMGIPLFEYLFRPLSVGIKVVIGIILISVNVLIIFLVLKLTKRIRTQVRSESNYCRKIVSRASEILEQAKLTEEERVDLEAAVQEAEQVIKEAERMLLIGPRFARRYI